MLLLGISLAYVVFGREPTLPLEYTVHVVTDGPIYSVIGPITNMKSAL